MVRQRYIVAKVSELPPGSRKIVEVGTRSIGVFNVDGQYYAIRNRCPHQGAPLCRGTLSGTMVPAGPKEYHYGLAGRVLRCPWHSWEFDVTTGAMIFVPDPMRVKAYTVTVERAEGEAPSDIAATAALPTLETYSVTVEQETGYAADEAMVVLYC
ncbi:MAG: Rieske (2Fe-2S) protein [Caldilineaceae bacterium]